MTAEQFSPLKFNSTSCMNPLSHSFHLQGGLLVSHVCSPAILVVCLVDIMTFFVLL